MFQIKSFHESDTFDSLVTTDISPEIHLKQFHAKFIHKPATDPFQLTSTKVSIYTKGTPIDTNSLDNDEQASIKAFFTKKNRNVAKLSLRADEILNQKIEALGSMNLDDRTVEESFSQEGPYKISSPFYQDLDKFKENCNLNSLRLTIFDETPKMNQKRRENNPPVDECINNLQQQRIEALESWKSSSSETDSSNSDNGNIINLQNIPKLIYLQEEPLICLSESTIEKDLFEEELSGEINCLLLENSIFGDCSIRSAEEVDINSFLESTSFL